MTYCVSPALQNDSVKYFYCVHCFYIQVCIWSWKGSQRWSQKPFYWCSSESWKPCTAREVSLPSVYNRSASATSNGEESLFQCCDSVVWGALCFPADLRKRILGGAFCPTTTALGPPTKPATEHWQGWVLLSALLPRNNCLIHYRTWSECLFRTKSEFDHVTSPVTCLLTGKLQ